MVGVDRGVALTPPPLPGLLIKDKAWRGSSPSMEADMSYIYECIVGVFPVDRMYKGIQTLVIQSKYANVSRLDAVRR